MLAQKAERPSGNFWTIFFCEEFKQIEVSLYKHRRKNPMLLGDMDSYQMFSEEGLFLGVLIPQAPVIEAPILDEKAPSSEELAVPEHMGLFPDYNKLLKTLTAIKGK